MHPSSSDSDVFKYFTCSFLPHARHTPKLPSALFSCPIPTLSFLIPPLPLLSLSVSSCLALDLSTVFVLAPLPLVLADTATTAVFATASPQLVLAKGAASTILALAPAEQL